jgi:hypothetical protein
LLNVILKKTSLGLIVELRRLMTLVSVWYLRMKASLPFVTHVSVLYFVLEVTHISLLYFMKEH